MTPTPARPLLDDVPTLPQFLPTPAELVVRAALGPERSDSGPTNS